MSAFVYILYSEKLNKFYVGSTPDIDRRFAEHNRGKDKFTKTGIPWILVYKEAFEDLKQARQREVYIKKMKSRKYIETLISSDGQETSGFKTRDDLGFWCNLSHV